MSRKSRISVVRCCPVCKKEIKNVFQHFEETRKECVEHENFYNSEFEKVCFEFRNSLKRYQELRRISIIFENLSVLGASLEKCFGRELCRERTRLTKIGNRNFLGHTQTASARSKISLAKLNNTNSKGIHWSKESCEKLSRTLRIMGGTHRDSHTSQAKFRMRLSRAKLTLEQYSNFVERISLAFQNNESITELIRKENFSVYLTWKILEERFSVELVRKRRGQEKKYLRGCFRLTQAFCTDLIDDLLQTRAEREKTWDWLRNEKTNRNLFVDAFWDKFNLVFEYEGHQHFTFPNAFHRSFNEFQNEQCKDEYKRKLIREHNLLTFVIREDNLLLQEALRRYQLRSREIDSTFLDFLRKSLIELGALK